MIPGLAALIAVTLAIDPGTAQVISSVIQTITLVYVYHLKTKVVPPLEHVEDIVTSNLETRKPGGRRELDP